MVLAMPRPSLRSSGRTIYSPIAYLALLDRSLIIDVPRLSSITLAFHHGVDHTRDPLDKAS